MLDNLKKILNEDQDPKAIEKISAKLESLLMKSEEIGYIAVQKMPAMTILPDSIVVTNKRIILCRPKNLGLSMEFIDYDWEDVNASFVKEGILGAEFTFTTKSDITHTMEYLPKNQVRKLYTYAKERLEELKAPKPNLAADSPIEEEISVFELPIEHDEKEPEVIEVEEVEAEEVTNFAEIIPSTSYELYEEPKTESTNAGEKRLTDLSQDELFDKLQNYKRLLDNGLIMQGEYDRYKKEILALM
ncbi:PH domain-containing protein [Flavobacterium ardleyense]|uniref:PH domain-containing protein n=1 Tax=Flavobacterium ardleyense TaxID=2038737 RepID=UPI00298D1F25|nr:PH domain-containing protein [Flavobacterium ardleyense]